MESEYNILYSVFFKHQYFSDAKLNCLNISPSETTNLFILNNGLIFKKFRDGFHILYESKKGNVIKLRKEILDNSTIMQFVINLNDNEFYNYTSDFSNDITNTIFYFQNIYSSIENSGSISLLHLDEYVSGSDIISVNKIPNNFFSKPFGVIDIKLKDELSEVYTINFTEKTTYWRYIFVGEHLQEVNSPAVISEDELFLGPEKVVLPDNRTALTFVSSQPIGIFQIPKKTFQFVENYNNGSSKHKVVLRSLPSPDIKSISILSSINHIKEYNYSEIFIY